MAKKKSDFPRDVGGENFEKCDIEHGSDEHAQMLGLRKATDDDDPQLVMEGWTLENIIDFGPTAELRYLKAILHQRVTELTTPPQMPQNEDRTEPNYAPPMWRPGTNL